MKLTDEQRALAEKHWPAALAVAGRFRRRYGDIPDWEGAAAAGVCRCVRYYDPDRGVPPGDYLSWAAHQECRRHLHRTLPKGYRWQGAGRTPPPQLVPVREDLDGRPDERPVAGASLETRDLVERLLRAASPRQRLVLRLIYLDTDVRGHADVARGLGVSETRVAQIRLEALARIRRDAGLSPENPPGRKVRAAVSRDRHNPLIGGRRESTAAAASGAD